jgi:hypothetical protein
MHIAWLLLKQLEKVEIQETYDKLNVGILQQNKGNKELH